MMSATRVERGSRPLSIGIIFFIIAKGAKKVRKKAVSAHTHRTRECIAYRVRTHRRKHTDTVQTQTGSNREKKKKKTKKDRETHANKEIFITLFPHQTAPAIVSIALSPCFGNLNTGVMRGKEKKKKEMATNHNNNKGTQTQKREKKKNLPQKHTSRVESLFPGKM